jgi:hypothetical protein
LCWFGEFSRFGMLHQTNLATLHLSVNRPKLAKTGRPAFLLSRLKSQDVDKYCLIFTSYNEKWAIEGAIHFHRQSCYSTTTDRILYLTASSRFRLSCDAPIKRN